MNRVTTEVPGGLDDTIRRNALSLSRSPYLRSGAEHFRVDQISTRAPSSMT